MKKVIFLFLLIMSLSGNVYADDRTVYCEIEDKNAVTYYVRSMNSGWGFKYYKFFVKYVDSNGNVDYWFRISQSSKGRFLYNLGIEVNNQKYELDLVKNPTYAQIYSGTDKFPNSFETSYAIYHIPQNIINEIMKTNEPIILYINKQNRQEMKMNSDKEFTEAIHKIIGLDYSNKSEYWQPNVLD